MTDTRVDVGNYGSVPKSEAPEWRWRSVVLAIIGQWCCFICGVPAVVASLVSYTDHRQGDFERYRTRKRMAIKLAIAAIIFGIIVVALEVWWVTEISGKVNDLVKHVYAKDDKAKTA